MGVQGCMKCIKYILFGFNFFFWLAGGAVLGIALWLRFDSQTRDVFDMEGAPTTFYVGVNVLMGAGALMMLIGFLGCCGAIQESQCMLGSFFICLLVVFAAEIAAGIWGFMNKDQIPEDITKFYTRLYDDYKRNSTPANKAPIVTFHKAFDCCGLSKTSSTSSSIYSTEDICTSKAKNKDCKKEIKEIFTTKVYIIAFIGISMGVVMIFGMIFSMALCCSVRNREYM
uniref:CD9 antigen-like isoform X2 n=1 Tax=Myxine glutinosa TaxID=7769 RepID=UPI00358F512B